MNRIFPSALLALAACAAPAAVHDRGGGLLYDDVLKVTWLQDANFAKTSGAHPTGKLSWAEANAWVSRLVYQDPVRKRAIAGWRLPSVAPAHGEAFDHLFRTDGKSDEGYNITSANAEFSFMYYVNLGITGWYLPDGSHSQDPKHRVPFGVMKKNSAIWEGEADVGPVRHLQSNIYWCARRGSRQPAPADDAWIFVPCEGNQRDGLPHPNAAYVWPVVDGDVAAPDPDQAQLKARCDAVAAVPNLVAFWTFGEEPGTPRASVAGAARYPLLEVGHPVARVAGGPFSGHAAHFDGDCYLRLPADQLGALNIGGKQAQVSMFAVVRLAELKGGRTIAGIWSEGKGAGDDTGTRQYSMLINMPLYGGAERLTPHISGEGGVSRRADRSGLPWCADYPSPRSLLPVGRWVTLAFTYDGSWIRAYQDGVFEERPMDPEAQNRKDPYFTTEGPNGGHRGMNPYYYNKGIFRYDPALHATSKPSGQCEFTVAARNAGGNMLGEALKGDIAALAVFDRALSAEEVARLHAACALGR